MKIFYIYTALLTKGGADRVITEKANWLAEHGYEVGIITDTQMGRQPIFPLSPKVKLHDLAIDFSQEYGHSLPIRIWWYFKLMGKYKKELKDYLYKEKPDIVISTLGRDLDFLTTINDGSIKIGESHIARLYSRNFHLLEQKGGVFKLLAKYGRWKQERCTKKLDALVLLTKQDADCWQGTTKTYVIPNSLPFYPQESSTCENKRAICVGRLSEQKGMEYLIEAWSYVHKNHPDWKLDIYGYGELKEEMTRSIAALNLTDVISINEPTNDIIQKYLESSIYIMSSRFEGFGMVLLEAMACGVPCISFDCPYGPADIIRSGEDGFLVEHLNAKALADSICQLIEQPELRKQFGEKAKKNIIRYSKDNVMKKWTELFNELTHHQ
jgi:glycosyltransferase involved in cell wall biosynthesis